MRATLSSQGDGRTRRRVEAMRRVQEVALELFERRGFDGVSIEEIAEAAGVGPATVYRNFGTKEGVVLWDEYDPMLLEAITRELAEHPPIEAVERAVVSSLSAVYRADLARIVRRSKLIRATPAIAREAELGQRALRQALADVLLQTRAARDELEARVFAGALVGALVAGVYRWLDGGAREPLARTLTRAFACLGRLA